MFVAPRSLRLERGGWRRGGRGRENSHGRRPRHQALPRARLVGAQSATWSVVTGAHHCPQQPARTRPPLAPLKKRDASLYALSRPNFPGGLRGQFEAKCLAESCDRLAVTPATRRYAATTRRQQTPPNHLSRTPLARTHPKPHSSALSSTLPRFRNPVSRTRASQSFVSTLSAATDHPGAACSSELNSLSQDRVQRPAGRLTHLSV